VSDSQSAKDAEYANKPKACRGSAQSRGIKSDVGLKEINIVVKMGKEVARYKTHDHISSHMHIKQGFGADNLPNRTHFIALFTYLGVFGVRFWCQPLSWFEKWHVMVDLARYGQVS
jgi:hypothetical protein